MSLRQPTMATAHSAAPLNDAIHSSEHYVWPTGKGNLRGHSIVPLYPSAIEAAQNDRKLYELLALVDALRVGRAREKEWLFMNCKNGLSMENRTYTPLARSSATQSFLKK
jgi:hypothetical protein